MTEDLGPIEAEIKDKLPVSVEAMEVLLTLLGSESLLVVDSPKEVNVVETR